MEIVQGTITYKKSRGSGFFNTISKEGETFRFFSKNDSFSLFEKCEVVLSKKNNTYFLDDFVSLEDTVPLRQNPGNFIAASWLAELARSFMMPDDAEFGFIEKCRSALSGDFDSETLDSLEKKYCEISGLPADGNRENVLEDYFSHSINIRRSLLKQLKIRGKNDHSSQA